eukprot:7836396-Ditylum_brightwellii.AAC.1
MPLLLPHLPHHVFHQYDAPDASLMWGDNVACCGFAGATDPLRRLCHVLVLGPGQWQEQPMTSQRVMMAVVM